MVFLIFPLECAIFLFALSSGDAQSAKISFSPPVRSLAIRGTTFFFKKKTGQKDRERDSCINSKAQASSASLSYLQRRKPPAAQTLDNRPEFPGTLLKDKLAAVPDGDLFVVQELGLQTQLTGRVDEVVVDLDKDARAHLDHFIWLARVLDPEGTAPPTNLVRLLENSDEDVLVLVLEVGWLQVVVEEKGG